jgi:hypothetical protein
MNFNQLFIGRSGLHFKTRGGQVWPNPTFTKKVDQRLGANVIIINCDDFPAKKTFGDFLKTTVMITFCAFCCCLSQKISGKDICKK